MQLPDARNRKEHIGYVSDCEDVQDNRIFGKEGNVYDEQRFSIKNFFLPEMVDACELTNKKQAKVAVIELVDLDTPLDERHTEHYQTGGMTGSEDLPYIKTRAGALQGRKMPWDYDREQTMYAGIGALASIAALLMRVR